MLGKKSSIQFASVVVKFHYNAVITSEVMWTSKLQVNYVLFQFK